MWGKTPRDTLVSWALLRDRLSLPVVCSDSAAAGRFGSRRMEAARLAMLMAAAPGFVPLQSRFTTSSSATPADRKQASSSWTGETVRKSRHQRRHTRQSAGCRRKMFSPRGWYGQGSSRRRDDDSVSIVRGLSTGPRLTTSQLSDASNHAFEILSTASRCVKGITGHSP